MRTAIIDQITIARKRAEAESLELKAQRLRREADEVEAKLLTRPLPKLAPIMPVSRDFEQHITGG